MKNRRTNIIFFFIATFFYWFSVYTYVPILPSYIRSFGTNYKMVGIILGSYGFAQMLLRIPLGVYSDRIGKRKPFIFSGLIFSLIGSMGLYIAVNPAGLLAARSFTGFAAASFVTFTILFSSYFKKEEAQKAIGYIITVTALSQLCGMLIGGWIAKAMGTKASFILASAGAVISILFMIFVKEDHTLERKKTNPELIRSAIKDKSLLFFSFMAVIVQFMTFATVFSFTPLYAVGLGADPMDLSILSAAPLAATTIAASLSGSFLPRTLGNRKTLIYGFILSSLSALVIPFTTTLTQLLITQAIGGFSRGIVFTMLMGLSIKNIKNDKRATAMGFFQAIYGIGMFSGPWLTGVINDLLGLSKGFYLIAIVGFAGTLLLIVKGKYLETDRSDTLKTKTDK